jgi:EAL domain-containing protein (putative c-di-GMP-specific phosphodiesterase class I)
MISQADLGLLDGFERALINGRLRMAYQPNIIIRRPPAPVEALIMDDPNLRRATSRFVPLAERHGLIDQMTQWGLRTTLRQWISWREQGLDTCLAFNISALNLDQLDFPDLVERMCRALEVPADRLVLELTEGATQPLIKLMDSLTRFRIKGIGLAIDDFGVGYSTLMQLRQLPFTELKIDRFFIDEHKFRIARCVKALSIWPMAQLTR